MLPVELLTEIIHIHIAKNTFSDDHLSLEYSGSSKPHWNLFSSLSLTSKTCRALALEAWFRVLVIKDNDGNFPFPEIKTKWTREIYCMHIPSWSLDEFVRAHKVRINGIFQDHSFPASLNILEADIRDMPWPSPLPIQRISESFPNLRILHLRQAKIWCGLCHTCCVPKFQQPCPKTIRYEGGIGLPLHYTRAFSSLSNLESVHLTVGMLETGKTTLGSEEGKNQNLWSGECDRCMEVMYGDESFRTAWVFKKDVAPKPPRLSVVEWCFWTKKDTERTQWEHDEYDQDGDWVELEIEDIEHEE
ncbi:hypothetical protein GYMLUDRAFT_247015 [Collybiopsis luxurians FD-317 M1]|uniref:Uncharacterized protein n=1 Tax=Collybiopsis luxurians FD-317 M1 TaxID=944289 RepID=A0A0D0BQH2_9AGAR|nr:hypothetical protein GYMLUDRAFT_247015 [Collybiopsis luxurians FD-317 M1]